MTRSVWKSPYCARHVIRGAKRVLASGKLSTVIKIHSRASVILPNFLGLTFGVYNGKDYIPVRVNDELIGSKFGEYSPTRKYTGHGSDKKTSRK